MGGINIRAEGEVTLATMCNVVMRWGKDVYTEKEVRRSGYSYGSCRLALILKASISGYFSLFFFDSSFFNTLFFFIFQAFPFARLCVLCNEVSLAVLSVIAEVVFPLSSRYWFHNRWSRTSLAPWPAFQIKFHRTFFCFFPSHHRSKGQLW